MQTNGNKNEYFEGFEHKADILSGYLYSKATGLFTLGLKGSNVTVHFTPQQPEAFRQWLDEHNIKDISIS